MPSQYCVVQFVPDPIADERVNIGILAFDDKKVRSVFLDDWRRPLALAGPSVMPLRKVIRDLELGSVDDAQEQLLQSHGGTVHLTSELIGRFAERWSHSVQLTPPRGSLADVDTVLEEMSQLMLRQGTP